MVPRLLQIVGLILIIVGVVIGLNSYEVDISGYGDFEKSFTVLFAWIGVGAFSGLLLIGFGEVIHKLDDLIKKP